MKVCTEKICYVINKINENKLSQIIFYENIENILLGNTNPPLFSSMVWKMKLCSLPQQANIDHTKTWTRAAVEEETKGQTSCVVKGCGRL